MRKVSFFLVLLSLFFIFSCSHGPTYVEFEYRVSGTASSVALTIEDAYGGTAQYTDVSLTSGYWWYRWEQNDYFDTWLYVSAQNQGSTGSVTVQILVDGVVVRTTTSSGAYVIASQSYSYRGTNHYY